jgi:hypothetical protein
MKRWPLLIALLTVVWGLSAPVAMASDHCLTMRALCEGPCSASSCAVSASPSLAFVHLLMPAAPPAAEHVPQAAPQVAEPPPKLLLQPA